VKQLVVLLVQVAEVLEAQVVLALAEQALLIQAVAEVLLEKIMELDLMVVLVLLFFVCLLLIILALQQVHQQLQHLVQIQFYNLQVQGVIQGNGTFCKIRHRKYSRTSYCYS